MKTLAEVLKDTKVLDISGTLSSQFYFEGLNKEFPDEFVLSFSYEEDDNTYSYKCTSEQVEAAVRNTDGNGWIITCAGYDWDEEINIIPYGLNEL